MRNPLYQPPDQEALQQRINRLDIKGNHLWVIMASWAIANPEVTQNDATGQVIMDRENLVVFGGPMCFKCERAYNERIAKRTCHGSIDK
jgi:hypothetical protein